MGPSDTRLKVAILCDYAEENWPSMDLVADLLLEKLAANHAESVEAVRVRPRFRWRFAPGTQDAAGVKYNADRVLNRFIDYPFALRRCRDQFDVFHLMDHSYSHLVRYLPAARTIVTCHDTDSFRCVLEPARERRSPLFKLMTRYILGGFRAAAIAACDSEATRQDVLRHRLREAERTTTILNGVSSVFTANDEPESDLEASQWIGERRPGAIEILHVGSTIPRKRVDVLLRVFAGIRGEFRDARLIRVSGPFTPGQAALVRELGIEQAVTVLPFIPATTLAALYRRAALVIIPSEAEGFGLPLAEAMACGTSVVASDLPALREVGGEAALFASAGDVAAMTQLALSVLRNRDGERAAARRQRALANAARFSWTDYADRYAALYQQVAQREPFVEFDDGRPNRN